MWGSSLVKRGLFVVVETVEEQAEQRSRVTGILPDIQAGRQTDRQWQIRRTDRLYCVCSESGGWDYLMAVLFIGHKLRCNQRACESAACLATRSTEGWDYLPERQTATEDYTPQIELAAAFHTSTWTKFVVGFPADIVHRRDTEARDYTPYHSLTKHCPLLRGYT